MQYHIINSSKFGGAELIAARLSKKLSDNCLIIIFKNNHLFTERLKIDSKNLFFLLRNIFSNNENSFFSHNIQAHIILNILHILKRTILKTDSSKYYNVIHFDAFHIKKFWLNFYINLLKIYRPKLIFVSEYSKNQFFKKISFFINSQVINNSISDDFFEKKHSGRSLKKLNTNELKIGFIGRYSPVKQLPLFLEICLELKKITKKDYKFYIQSDISRREINKLLEKIIKRNNYQFNYLDIVLYKSQQNPKIFYRSIDILISTSKTETFGLTCIEALAMGKRIYTINSKSIELLFGKVNFNLKAKRTRDIAKLLINSFDKKYILPDISKFKDCAMIKEYSKL
tara:strand:- start:347 stop:1372 length:1026 start_codon:yes stop_codon:yes gene_type:complete